MCSKVKFKKHYENNKQQYIKRAKIWKRENKDKVLASGRRYVAKLKVERPEYLSAKWSKENRLYRERYPDKVRAGKKKAKAIRKNVPTDNTVTPEFLQSLRERQEDCCHYCWDTLDFDTPGAVHLDHKQPLSRGGAHTATNVVYACASCNLSKGAKTEKQFLSEWE